MSKIQEVTENQLILWLEDNSNYIELGEMSHNYTSCNAHYNLDVTGALHMGFSIVDNKDSNNGLLWRDVKNTGSTWKSAYYMTETKSNPYEIRENWLELQKVCRLFNFNLTGTSHSCF